jgi:hypothetical protein
VKRDVYQGGEAMGLAASGSSGRWDVTVDESPDGSNWWAEIEGPQVYLTFALSDVGVVAAASDFLHRKLEAVAASSSKKWSAAEDALTLGQFGAAPVSLLWDDEGVARCFLVVIPAEGSALRLSLGDEDIRSLGNAFRQAANELPPSEGGSASG